MTTKAKLGKRRSQSPKQKKIITLDWGDHLDNLYGILHAAFECNIDEEFRVIFWVREDREEFGIDNSLRQGLDLRISKLCLEENSIDTHSEYEFCDGNEHHSGLIFRCERYMLACGDPDFGTDGTVAEINLEEDRLKEYIKNHKHELGRQ